VRIHYATQTDVGRRKDRNEDYFGVFREDAPGLTFFKEGALFLVADGLGGHAGGEIASKLGVSIVKDLIKEPPPEPPEDPDADAGYLPVIRKYIKQANDNIFRTNQELVKGNRPMGTTMLAVLALRNKVFIGNVGDSRCYLVRAGEIIEKTIDHSWVDEQVKLGLMSKSEAESDLRRNIVTRSVGTHEEVVVDTYRWHMVPGDVLLMCTDGLINMVKDVDINAEFQKRATPAEIAQRLVNRANENGGKDNITVIVAHISPNLFQLMVTYAVRFFRKHWQQLMWTLLALLFGAACFVVGRFSVKWL